MRECWSKKKWAANLPSSTVTSTLLPSGRSLGFISVPPCCCSRPGWCSELAREVSESLHLLQGERMPPDQFDTAPFEGIGRAGKPLIERHLRHRLEPSSAHRIVCALPVEAKRFDLGPVVDRDVLP